jgi:arginyl-tRNA--protein-N-Asp/Glu arginylyltransferase
MDITRQDEDGTPAGKPAAARKRADAPARTVLPAAAETARLPAAGGPSSRPQAVGPHAMSAHQFFATAPVACPYVAGRAERKLIVELAGDGAAAFYDDLSRAGFRRSHRFAYRPACRGCASCVPVRIAVDRFSHTRSTRRVLSANRDLCGQVVAARATPEQFRLFWTYQRVRHNDSDMAAMDYADYRAMIEDTPVRTLIAEFRDGDGRLVAASLLDLLDDGLSAVYSFYDPMQAKRGLGTWSILWLVAECRRRALPYVYLGYWIAESPKMAYKARFTGLERLVPGGWLAFPRAPAGSPPLSPPAPERTGLPARNPLLPGLLRPRPNLRREQRWTPAGVKGHMAGAEGD